jgi:TMEM175 potassium channel family protein
MNNLHNEVKKEFQLERLILFSDAVFAIAITLLIIEIKIPEIHENVTDQALLKSLVQLAPKFSGFIISFLMIGLYWTVHHRMFGFVINYSPRLLWLNLFFLFFIVLMPFSTAFYGEYWGEDLIRNQLKVPMTFYVMNLVFVGLTNYFLWSYIAKPKHKLIDNSVDSKVIRAGKLRAIVVPACFFLMLPVAYLTDVFFAVFIPILIPIFLWIVRRNIAKENKTKSIVIKTPVEHEKDNKPSLP